MQRKLTAILSADVVGYSGLMEADESGTLERLKVNRARIFDPYITIHGGRLFKLMGDGALVEFPSVIAAVNCALAIQEATEKSEAALAEPRRIRYRIGINLGEVIVEGDDIYGEGVNVAARLQALAPVGGVALSLVVRDQVEGKAPCVFEDMGEHRVKNIERPVHVFSVRREERPQVAIHKSTQISKLGVCVLPFSNMSGDIEQEYFSDGISEDIITDLSKVSALSVVARNTAFTFKGKSVKIPQVARELNVSHVLEGSVRKAGGRVRITAQLIDGTSGNHVWAERYDRDLNDIFALQDEISEAIVGALKLKLLPEEKKAIERRGTDSPDAYNLYLMARQDYVSGNHGDIRRDEAIVRMCSRATEIDPAYAEAWALKALAQALLRFEHGQLGDGGLAAAEQALALNENLAEAHAVKTRILFNLGRHDEAFSEMQIALSLDAESYEVNVSAGYLSYRQGKLPDSIHYFEKALSLSETDVSCAGMLIACYRATENRPAVRHAAEIAVARAEHALKLDRNNGSAIAHGVIALAVLGQAERAKEWIGRAMLVNPYHMGMRYNFACALANHLGDVDGALELLEPVFATLDIDYLEHAKIDPDLDPLRDNPRFQQMLASFEARVGNGSSRT